MAEMVSVYSSLDKLNIFIQRSMEIAKFASLLPNFTCYATMSSKYPQKHFLHTSMAAPYSLLISPMHTRHRSKNTTKVP
jgi:hypothetical protein